MSNNSKNVFHISLSKDVAKFINDYASEKEINKSVAAERILLKGIEVMEQNNTNKIVEEIKINLDSENENDKAIYNMFNSIPD